MEWKLYDAAELGRMESRDKIMDRLRLASENDTLLTMVGTPCAVGVKLLNEREGE